MNNKYKVFQPILDVVELTARKFYGYYHREFRESGMEVEDLINECLVKALETINFKRGEHAFIFQTCNQAVGWHLKNMLKKIRRNNYVQPKVEDINYIQDSKQIKQEASNTIDFVTLISILDDKEKNIVREIIENGSTLNRLSQYYECSEQRIDFIYKRALDKIRKNIT